MDPESVFGGKMIDDIDKNITGPMLACFCNDALNWKKYQVVNNKGYFIRESIGSGKCVRGMSKTKTIQVFVDWGVGGGLLLKQIRFKRGDEVSKSYAIFKAKKFINEKVNENG